MEGMSGLDQEVFLWRHTSSSGHCPAVKNGLACHSSALHAMELVAVGGTMMNELAANA